MAKEMKVERITDMEKDFAQWYTDVCTKAELIDYSSIKGMFIYRPYGYAIWENIQRLMDIGRPSLTPDKKPPAEAGSADAPRSIGRGSWKTSSHRRR